jgi:competence protein ComEC
MRPPGTPRRLIALSALVASGLLVSCDERYRSSPTEPNPALREIPTAAATGVAELVVRVLEVGQGDATVITNGASTVIIDGGSSGTRFGQLLDSLGLQGTTLDAVIASSGASHDVSGLRALFDRRRNIQIRYYFDNTDPTSSGSLTGIRDSVNARVARGETVYRDTDDPCGDGSPICTLTLAGGARLHLMRPDPDGNNTGNRSTPVKLVGPDSATFSMWFAGDARTEATDWFVQGARYHEAPGMKVHVLKGLDHGHCRSMHPRFLAATAPEWVTFSLAADNGSGLVHEQTLELIASQGAQWYRTDQNGSITFRTAAGGAPGYTVSVDRGNANPVGPQDEASTSRNCSWEPPPAAPSDLSATAVSSFRIDLRWTDNASDESGFQVERRSGSGSFQLVGSVGADVVAYSDTTLAPGTSYDYRVRAYHDEGSSLYSEIASATTPGASEQPPAAPSNLAAVASSSTVIELTWTDNSADESGFRLQRRLLGESFQQIAVLSANAQSYRDTQLAAGTTYEYRVRAYNDAGTSAWSNTTSATTLAPPAAVSELVVRVLDVGQGDATVITNGSSTVIIDGGSNGTRFGQLLDSLDLRGKTIDAVIVSHGDTDHASGLRAVFDRSRNIRVDYFFDNMDPTTSSGHQTVRDSVNARVARGETIYRDTDDPCGNGAPLCTLTLAGGARVHVMRPDPNGAHSDNRSNPVKVVGPDSASFSMWLAGDARYDAADWFMDVARYDLYPGMRVNVLKGQEHGNCRSLQPRYLSAVDPDWVTFSLAAENGKGLVNIQTMELLANQGKPWYRTDQNGGITFRSPGTPGGGYTASVHRGAKNMSGPHDELSTSRQCRW